MRGVVFALLAIAASGVQAAPPSAAGAQAYVAGLYRAVGRETFDWRSVRFAPPLAALLHRDAAQSDRLGVAGALEADPFCECQDIDADYRFVSASATLRGPATATVTALIRNGGPRRFVVEVAWIGGGWRVADIRGPEHGSLLAYLRHEVPAAERAEKRL